MSNVVEIKRTCSACPSQWEGILDDGRSIYVRYRWGNITAGIGDTLDEAIRNKSIYFSYGDEFDGYITDREMVKLLKKQGVKVKEPLRWKAFKRWLRHPFKEIMSLFYVFGKQPLWWPTTRLQRFVQRWFRCTAGDHAWCFKSWDPLTYGCRCCRVEKIHEGDT